MGKVRTSFLGDARVKVGKSTEPWSGFTDLNDLCCFL
jgi:hypothetical protein